MTLAAAGGGTAHASTGTNASGAPVAHDDATPVQPFPLGSVTLLDSAFRANQRRNSAYLRFVDIDRLLHTFRTNVGLPSTAQPCGGWEGPSVELRGHSTGHLLSGLALAYANTGERALRDKGHRLVAALAECQAASPPRASARAICPRSPRASSTASKPGPAYGRRTTRSTRSWPGWSSSTG